MSRYLSFASLIVLLVLVSCGKEQSFEQGRISRGSLQDPSGDCQTKTIAGNYKVGQALADSNYIDVLVSVTQPGRYTIFTDTVNGYSFKAAGNFGSAGLATVRLVGSGTPTVDGIDDFIMFYDSSFCSFSITVLPNTGSSGGTAVYALQSTGGSCITANASGTYTQGIALNSANKVDIQVNVTTVGTWNVTTASVSGFSFSGSGTFTTTGVQNITLTASGTPTAAGSQTFPVTVGTSSCSFVITVGGGTTPPPTGEYFPLTQNSYWTYDDGAGSDTLKVTVNGTATKAGKAYQRFITTYESGDPNDTSFYRKDNAGNYYNYSDTSGFDGFGIGLKFTQSSLDVLFLKSSLNTGATWNSDFSASVQVQGIPVPVTVRFKFTCMDANATVTANGKTFTNVYKINTVVQAGPGGSNFQDAGTPVILYYAKGVGRIKVEDQVFGDNQEIRYWKVF